MAMDDEDEEPIPHQWGESYKHLQQMINPPGRPKAQPTKPMPPSKPAPMSPAARREMTAADKRAQAEGTESLAQMDKRKGRK